MTVNAIVGAAMGLLVTVLTVLLALWIIRFVRPAAEFGGIKPRDAGQGESIPE